MRYGIISDIHGNLEALEVALATLDGCDRWICLGDIVGYGPNPNECCERVDGLDGLCVVGNHDLAALGHYDLSWFNEWAAAAIHWTQETLSDANKAFLQSLPLVQVVEDLQATLKHFVIVHGSLREPAEEYITSTWDALGTFARMDVPLCLIGHTHVAEYYAKDDSASTCERVSRVQGGVIQMESDRQYIVNCGSVGQPRDRNPQASCGLLDTQACSIEVYRVDYPIAITQQKMQSEGLPDFLWQRLAMGM
jgi:predicted phosphodiesterase